MIQIKIFEGSKSEIQEELNAFLQLSNIEYVDIKIINETKIILIYDCIEPTKLNDLIRHLSDNPFFKDSLLKQIRKN